MAEILMIARVYGNQRFCSEIAMSRVICMYDILVERFKVLDIIDRRKCVSIMLGSCATSDVFHVEIIFLRNFQGSHYDIVNFLKDCDYQQFLATQIRARH